MSVLVNFAMFPTDRGASVSSYVAKIERAIVACGFPSQLTPMSTIVETDTMQQALSVIQAAYDAIAGECGRIYMTASIEAREGEGDRMKGKVESVMRKMEELG